MEIRMNISIHKEDGVIVPLCEMICLLFKCLIVPYDTWPYRAVNKI